MWVVIAAYREVPGVYSALPLQMRRHFLAASFGGDVKPSVPGFWLTLALGYSKDLVSHMNVW